MATENVIWNSNIKVLLAVFALATCGYVATCFRGLLEYLFFWWKMLPIEMATTNYKVPDNCRTYRINDNPKVKF